MFFKVTETLAIDAIQYTAEFSRNKGNDTDTVHFVNFWSLHDLQTYFRETLGCNSFYSNYAEDEHFGFAEIPFDDLLLSQKFEGGIIDSLEISEGDLLA